MKCIQRVVDGIAGPGNLPGAEVRLSALLVKISEQQTQQQSNDAGNDDDAGGDGVDTIHED